MAKRGRPPIKDPQLRPAWARRLAGVRAELGLSQAELAERLNVSQSSIADYERGESAPPMDLFMKISQQLGRNAAEIVLGPFPDKEAELSKEVDEGRVDPEAGLGPMQEDVPAFDKAFVTLADAIELSLERSIGYKSSKKVWLTVTRQMWRTALRMDSSIPIEVRVQVILTAVEAIERSVRERENIDDPMADKE